MSAYWITSWDFVVSIVGAFVFAVVFLCMGRVFFKEWPGLVDILMSWRRPLILEPFLDVAMATKWGQVRLFLWILTGALLFIGFMTFPVLVEHLTERLNP